MLIAPSPWEYTSTGNNDRLEVGVASEGEHSASASCFLVYKGASLSAGTFGSAE